MIDRKHRLIPCRTTAWTLGPGSLSPFQHATLVLSTDEQILSRSVEQGDTARNNYLSLTRLIPLRQGARTESSKQLKSDLGDSDKNVSL